MVNMHLVQLIWSGGQSEVFKLLGSALHNGLALDVCSLLEKLCTYDAAVGNASTYNACYGSIGHTGNDLLVEWVDVLEAHLDYQAIQQVLVIHDLLR